ncbi:MAG TPA: homoserine dehydrogenase [Candidatus Lokiarchaeia archaeon]|nr:homoserine dehydrogenase [Candidatus Lokiarchaeia archaeon]
MVNISVIGYGTVGKKFVDILAARQQKLQEKNGSRFNVTEIYEIDGAVINTEGIDIAELSKTHAIRDNPDWQAGVRAIDHIAEAAGDIVLEVTPTNPDTGEPALSHILAALNASKDVVSSNKGPFYLEYAKIMALAQEKGRQVRFSSTVGSAIPILAAKETLAGCEIVEIQAILNGTCNFILSRMTSENEPFDLALKEAQELGIAEADPTLDIEGYDAAGKLAILANHLMGFSKSIRDVQVEGITKVTAEAVELAKNKGLLIKQVGIAADDRLEVGLRLVPQSSPLAISGTLNAFMLKTDVAGDYFFIGRGAGGAEAGAGLLSDVIRIVKDACGRL